MNLPDYNPKFIEHVNQTGQPFNDATKYGVVIEPANVPPDKAYWRVIGVHHLTGKENHGQHHCFVDVLYENGQRAERMGINILTNGQPRGVMVIDKPANEAGSNTQMHWNDTLTVSVAGGLPSDSVSGLHTRHEDEEPGTTRGHHSFYVVWQLTVGAMFPSPPDPEEPEDPTEDPRPPVFGADDLAMLEATRRFGMALQIWAEGKLK